MLLSQHFTHRAISLVPTNLNFFHVFICEYVCVHVSVEVCHCVDGEGKGQNGLWESVFPSHPLDPEGPNQVIIICE